MWGGIALLVKGVIVFWEVGQKAIAGQNKINRLERAIAGQNKINRLIPI
ncbi:hypothetical protein [Nostoc sp. NMS4]|nr:hypothetical protein [Nostoc sp. NMS4]MBN3924497.1 hypothetical protein [Nostoc sp. NMS4]